ncbi:MAG: hypothetical protein MJ097_02855 [Dorea sp.]|nr:hypothetical protein [Dorea sp.]
MLYFNTNGQHVSSYGGAGVAIRTNVQKEYVREACDIYEICVTGLKGGHCYDDICYGNANSLLIRILRRLKESAPISLMSFDGGVSRSELCHEATAQIALRYYDVARCYENRVSFEETFEHAKEQILEEYSPLAPELNIYLRKLRPEMVTSVMTTDSFYRLLNIFTLMPDGIQTMSTACPGSIGSLVNIGMVLADTETFSISAELIGEHIGAMEEICAKFSLAANICGCSIQFFGVHLP